MHKDEHEISTHGANRRDKMLPLLQDAMKEHTRRRRQRRSLACSVLALCLIGVLFEIFNTTREQTGTSTTGIAMNDPEASATNGRTPPVPSMNDEAVRSGSPPFYTVLATEQLYQRCLDRNPCLIIQDDAVLAYTTEIKKTDAPVLEITTDELVATLAEVGIGTAISCTGERCSLYRTSNSGVIKEKKAKNQEDPLETAMLDQTPDATSRITDARRSG